VSANGAGTRQISLAEAEATLTQLADLFLQNRAVDVGTPRHAMEVEAPGVEDRYRALLDQIPAVVFMANLDEGSSEAYVSPQIEHSLGFSPAEWLEDPIRWYQHIHPDDKQRWSVEAAEMFLSGKPLRSSYRVIARDGHVVWFHCEAKMIRHGDGRPWFIHGVGVDVTDLKRAEQAFEEERNVLSAILDTVGALVVVLDRCGRIVRFNRACEQASGFSFDEVKGKRFLDVLFAPEERDRFGAAFESFRLGCSAEEFDSYWTRPDGSRRFISWSTRMLAAGNGSQEYVIATGVDRTERKQLEQAILETSAREQRRIGQDLHDGLGQHLTGVAFLSKAHEQRLADRRLPEAADAAKIVGLVNEAINKTRQLARGLLPVLSDSFGLMSALQQLASEVEELFHVRCRFDCEAPVRNLDEACAAHLYHMAQEAVHNAIEHGKAAEIAIGLSAGGGEGLLTIRDDGCGIPELPPGHTGIGLRIMCYRAGMIGGALRIEQLAGRGTLIACTFPI
jgi:PAS domain S-box-containing protein